MPRRSLVARLVPGVLALAAVVAVVIASAGSRVGQGDSRLVLPSLRAPLTVAGTAVFVLGVVLLIAVIAQRPGKRQYGRHRRSVLMQLFPLLLVMLVLILWAQFGHRSDNHSPAAATPGGGSADSVAPPVAARHGSADVVLVLAVLASGALVAAVAARRVHERAGDGAPEPRAAGAAVSDVLDDVIAELRRDPDPRRAVIAAYARLEQAFAFHGLARAPSEAPLEFLARALLRLDASRASIGRLTDLFEQAMFSAHAIDPRMQADAIDALVAVRDELRAAV